MVSDREYKGQAEALRRAAEKACASWEAARKFLVRAGIATKSGELTKAYRQAMYSSPSSLILGIHGCDKSVGERILRGDIQHLRKSENSYDWLGHGVYF